MRVSSLYCRGYTTLRGFFTNFTSERAICDVLCNPVFLALADAISYGTICMRYFEMFFFKRLDSEIFQAGDSLDGCGRRQNHHHHLQCSQVSLHTHSVHV